ncbi:MAG: hypothetical protein OEL89_00670 [Candidatus Peregrinibacteria bacterium]|nr:hypothetical protein [Candidatus Peregrinibacteria bacterium]
MSEGLENNQEVDVNDLQKKLDEYNEMLTQLKSTNERLLDEQKKNVEKYRRVRDENQELVQFKQEKEVLTKKQLESEENWKELLRIEQEEKERLAKEKGDYSSKAEKMAKMMIDKDLKMQVASYAPDAYDADTLLFKVKQKQIELDEENLTFKGVKEAIDDLRKDQTFLFNVKKAETMVNSIPKTSEPKQRTLDELSRQERLGLVLGKEKEL